MSPEELCELLWQDDPYNHPAWNAFKDEMREKQYGREPLNQAWWFFRMGWDAGRKEGVTYGALRK